MPGSQASRIPGDGFPSPGRCAESPAHNLPAQLTSFVGRDYEVSDVRRLLASGRLLTLTGPAALAKPGWRSRPPPKRGPISRRARGSSTSPHW